MAQGSALSNRFARQIIEIAERAGVASARLVRAAQLEPEQLEAAEGRVPQAAFYRLCELALELTQDASLGLHGAETTSGAGNSLVTPLIAHSGSLRQGLETLIQFQKLLGDQARFELLEDERDVTVRCVSFDGASSRVRRFMAELEAVGCFRMVRYFSASARPRQVNFDYPAPAYRAEYTRIFEGAEQFEQPFTGIVFDRALMNAASLHKDEEVYNALCVQAERRIFRVAEAASHADRVRDFLLRQGTPTRADMSSTARAVGLSMRSLRRHLAAEGTSYNRVANETFASVAKRLLSFEQRTIQETAYLLGYADSGAFHRAFKRWTGTTPNAFVRCTRSPPAARDQRLSGSRRRH